MRQYTHNRPKRRVKGFTLIEVMVAMTIASIVIATFVIYFHFNATTIYRSELRLHINQKIRKLTYEMGSHARQANRISLYEHYTSDPAEAKLAPGNSGDFLVMSIFEQDPGDPHGISYYTNIRGYLRGDLSGLDPNTTVDGELVGRPLYTFELELPANTYVANKGTSPASMGLANQTEIEVIVKESASISPTLLVESAKGLAEKRMFYRLDQTQHFNMMNDPIMIRAEIVQEENSYAMVGKNKEDRIASNTYNVTINSRQ